MNHGRESIGVGVFVINNNKLLIGKRGPDVPYGPGLLALPGGKLDPPETISACAIREVLEETGVTCIFTHVPDLRYSVHGLLTVTDHADPSQQKREFLKNHLTFWMLAKYVGGSPSVQEPGKAEWWRWLTLPELWAMTGDSCKDPNHPQYHWTPFDLWSRILSPHILN